MRSSLTRYQKHKPEVAEVYARIPRQLREAIETTRHKLDLSVYKTVEISLMKFLEDHDPETAERLFQELYGEEKAS